MKMLITLIGTTGIWSIYDFIIQSSFCLEKHNILKIFCSYTFFIYLFHVPAINIVRKVLLVPFANSPTGFAVSFLFSPLVFTLVIIIFASMIRKQFPTIYNVLTGKR